MICTDARGQRRAASLEKIEVEEAGPLCARLAVAGRLGKGTGLRFTGSLCFYAGSGLVRVELTAQNPRRARHPDGYWDLGDPGSELLRDLSLEVGTAAPGDRRVHWLEQTDGAAQTTRGDWLEIYQDSSGGEEWQSRNHVNREGRVPHQFCGYRVRTQDAETLGDRASPVVCVAWEGAYVGCALEEFWQKFPSALEVRGSQLIVRFWPRRFDDLHELQAGEHNTRVVWLEFGRADVAPYQRLAWVHNPPAVSVDPAWVAASGAIPFLPSPGATLRPAFAEMLREAVEGEQSFFAKREAIDEYGWRNFGDMWADHEQTYSDDPLPVISHYNNQYDLLYGLLVQWLLSGDRCWWQLADPLARHVMDIDIYHTDRDKPAYNGGLFWHTAHYHDVDRCTHRCMSTTMRGKRQPAAGGGPANEHNYGSGLLLYYYLTGCARARDTVVGLADWVIAMDDGRRHVLGVVSDQPTGDASRTTVPQYHGPGRGAGNSINALLDGWMARGSQQYLDKAVELIRRTIHPRDNVEAHDLDNAELRWSYTVYLQALVRFLELTRARVELSAVHAYVRESLLAYARWMADHEKFYLDEPERLEFPTETWAAQELRKGTVLWMAAMYAAPEERRRFRIRGQEILDRAWNSLMSFDSHRYTRPLALVLQQGYIETCLTSDIPESATAAEHADETECVAAPQEFVAQKEHLHQMLGSPARLAGAIPCAVRPSRWANVLQQTWSIELLRRWIDALR
ncbi:MAG: hypothetical protein HY000_24405 [Planctomycetes bacterium]|nr:hypothetical protein [Planctomycetota bacterium]